MWVVDNKIRTCQPSPVDEQPPGFRALHRALAADVSFRGQLQAADRHYRLARDPKALARRGQEPHLRAASGQGAGHGCARIEEVLTVVQDEQQLALGQLRRKRLERVVPWHLPQAEGAVTAPATNAGFDNPEKSTNATQS